MGTTAQKLNRVLQTKSDLKTVINYSGTNITNETTFKDYPKLLNKAYIDILNDEGESLYNALPKISGSGTSIDLNTEKGKMKIELNSTQIEQVSTSGNNLIKFPNIAETTVNGITYSIQDDVISLNGTATDNVRYIYASNFAFNGAGDYRITLIPISGNYTRGVIGISSRTEDKSTQIVWHQVADGGTTNKKTYTAENISQIKNIGIYINSGSVLNNLKFKFMFTKGDTTPTAYENMTSPTPDYPQDIHVITGKQNIEILGKNLIEPRLPTTTKNGITITNNGDGSWTLNGTATSNADFRIDQSTHNGHDNLKTYNGTYTLSCNELINGIELVITQINTWTTIARMRNNNTPITFTTNKDNCFIYVFVSSGTILNNLTIHPQLEKNSAVTSYKPYLKQNYPIDLLGKNLFDKDNANILNGWMDNNTQMYLQTSQNNRILYISCQPNTTYTISRSILTNAFRVATYDSTPIPTTTSTGTNYVINGLIKANNATSITITTGINAKYLLVHYGNIVNDTNINESLASIQIEKGSQATEYVPYFEPIELCKIENYQDYIYNDNGNWYLHKEINKVILNGGSNESYDYQNNHRFWLRRSYWTNETVPKNTTSYNDKLGLFCNRFIEVTPGETWADKEGISYDSPNTTSQPIGSTFNIACNSVATTVNDFKTWLYTNPLEVVYILQNPQDTQITDTTLIQQLDNLKNAKSYDDVTHITQTNDDLPFNLEVSALAKIE